MALTKENYELGQRGAMVSVVALILRGLKSKVDLSQINPLFKFVPDTQVAAYAAIAAIAVNAYFILRVWDQHLSDGLKARLVSDAPGIDERLSEEGRSRRGLNMGLQSVVKFLTTAIDFWLPVFLLALVCFAYWPTWPWHAF